jgi:hypothetical protein
MKFVPDKIEDYDFVPIKNQEIIQDKFDYVLIGMDPFILSIADNLKKINKTFAIIPLNQNDAFIYSDSYSNCKELFGEDNFDFSAEKINCLNNKKYIGFKYIFNFFYKKFFNTFKLLYNKNYFTELFFYNFYKNKFNKPLEKEILLSYYLNDDKIDYIKTNKNVYFGDKYIASESKYVYLNFNIAHDISSIPNSGMIYDKFNLFYMRFNNNIIVYILDTLEDNDFTDNQFKNDFILEINFILKKEFNFDYLITNNVDVYYPNISFGHDVITPLDSGGSGERSGPETPDWRSGSVSQSSVNYKFNNLYCYKNTINAETNIIDAKKLLLLIEPKCKNNITILRNFNFFDCLTYLFLLNIFSYFHSKIFKKYN